MHASPQTTHTKFAECSRQDDWWKIPPPKKIPPLKRPKRPRADTVLLTYALKLVEKNTDTVESQPHRPLVDPQNKNGLRTCVVYTTRCVRVLFTILRQHQSTGRFLPWMLVARGGPRKSNVFLTLVHCNAIPPAGISCTRSVSREFCSVKE